MRGVPAGKISSPVTRMMTAGRRMTGTVGMPKALSHPQVLRAQDSPGREHKGAGLDILAPPADVPAGRNGLDHPEDVSLHAADLDGHDRIGPFGKGRTRWRSRRPRQDRRCRQTAGRAGSGR